MTFVELLRLTGYGQLPYIWPERQSTAIRLLSTAPCPAIVGRFLMLTLRLFYPGLVMRDIWATGEYFIRGLNGPATRAPPSFTAFGGTTTAS